jgi:hypothetical protein
VTRSRKAAVIALLALAPLLVFFWLGYLELYRPIPTADVRVNGVAAGYAHRGRVSTIITRTDISGRHSYRVWPTATVMLIFDCPNWIAPESRYFVQGKISAPCIFATSGAGSSQPSSPSSVGVVSREKLSFTTRDGKTITMRAPY